MSPPSDATDTGPGLNTFPAEAQDETKVFSHSDPTFYEFTRRLDWGESDWTLRGPSFADGTYPIIRIEWRLGELIVKFLMRYSASRLSRKQQDRLKRGEPIESIRLVKTKTPVADSNANPSRNEGHTETLNS